MEKNSSYKRPDQCQNCRHQLSADDEFCPVCGQKALPEHLSLKYFLSEFLGNYFSFNSKLFKTLIPLTVTPGFLSSEYVKGRRVRYIPPVQLFVFMSLVYFFFLSITSLREFSQKDPDVEKSQSNLNTDIFVYSEGDTTGTSIISPNQAQLDSIFSDSDEEKVLIRFLKKAYEYNKLDTKTKFEKLSKYLSYLIFFILPLFALYTYWIFYKAGRGYVESLIFSLHFHAFIFLLGIIFLVFDRVIPDPIDLNLQYLAIILYLLLGLKRFFNYSWWSTLIRYVGLGAIYGFTVAVTLILALLFSILG